MYVEPNTNILLLQNVPLDVNYVNTLTFTDIGAQATYFRTKHKYRLTNFTYQRDTLGVIRVNVNQADLYDCNYLMYQNTSYGQKWFYAFITKTEYVNDNMTRVWFEQDVMQTWLFDWTFNYCLVQREHVADDTRGKNILAENLPIDEYVVGHQDEITFDPCVIVGVSSSTAPQDIDTNGIFNPLTYVGANPTNYGAFMNDFLAYFDSEPEKIAMLQMGVENMLSSTGISAVTSFDETKVINVPTNISVGGMKTYTPRNKKLLTYPYAFLGVDNYCGNSEQYAYEDFVSVVDQSFLTILQFDVHGVPSPVPVLSCRPRTYKGISDASNLYGIDYTDFPMCPMVIDNYRAWASQAVPKMLVNTGATIASAGASSLFIGASTGASLSKIAGVGSSNAGIMSTFAQTNGALSQAQTGTGAGLSLVSDLANFDIENRYHKLHGQSAGGHMQSGLNFDLGQVGFRFTQYNIKPEMAQLLDSYFDRFGYHVDTNKQPNVHSRAEWNYVKTAECSISGSIPADIERVICDIHNKGVTYWHNPEHVGNYSYTNSIV